MRGHLDEWRERYDEAQDQISRAQLPSHNTARDEPDEGGYEEKDGRSGDERDRSDEDDGDKEKALAKV